MNNLGKAQKASLIHIKGISQCKRKQEDRKFDQKKGIVILLASRKQTSLEIRWVRNQDELMHFIGEFISVVEVRRFLPT